MKPFADLAAKGNCDVRIFEEEITQRLNSLIKLCLARLSLFRKETII